MEYLVVVVAVLVLIAFVCLLFYIDRRFPSRLLLGDASVESIWQWPKATDMFGKTQVVVAMSVGGTQVFNVSYDEASDIRCGDAISIYQIDGCIWQKLLRYEIDRVTGT